MGEFFKDVSAGGDLPDFYQPPLSARRQSFSVPRQCEAEYRLLKIGEHAFHAGSADIPNFDLSVLQRDKEFLPIRRDGQLADGCGMLQLHSFGVERIPEEIPLEAAPMIIPLGIGTRTIPFNQFASAFNVAVYQVLSRLPHVCRIQQAKLPPRLRLRNVGLPHKVSNRAEKR